LINEPSYTPEWTSRKCIEEIRRRTDTILLSFTGKDLNRRLWSFPSIVPRVIRLLHRIPGLGLWSVARILREVFRVQDLGNCRIRRPYNHSAPDVSSPPENCSIIEAADLEHFSYED